MSAASWYYCDTDVDAERVFGPVSLERPGELIRTGVPPYDVLVSPEGRSESRWAQADRLEQVLDAVPLDRERLMTEYIAYGEAPRGEEHWGWASEWCGASE